MRIVDHSISSVALPEDMAATNSNSIRMANLYHDPDVFLEVEKTLAIRGDHVYTLKWPVLPTSQTVSLRWSTFYSTPGLLGGCIRV
jgi:hypothetical protein